MFGADHNNQPFELVSASNFSADELAEIYNAGRVDYIVPMPMNAKRIQSYVRTYDVDLDASVVIYDHNHQPAGIGMLGIRDDRGWITRLGIIPEKRKAGMGITMMKALIHAAKVRYARLAARGRAGERVWQGISGHQASARSITRPVRTARRTSTQRARRGAR